MTLLPRHLTVLVSLAFIPLFLGCGVPASIPVHYAGLAANRALPVLVQIEEREGDLAIADHPNDPEAIKAELAAVEARWAAFWTAWDAFVTAQNAWADAVEQGSDAAVISAAEKTAVEAFCATKNLLPEGVAPEVLAVAEVACPQ